MILSSTTNAIRATFVVVSILLGTVIAKDTVMSGEDAQLAYLWTGAIYGSVFAGSVLLGDFA